MKQLELRNEARASQIKSWVGTIFLIILAFAFSWNSLTAPFVVGGDAWSNLLPIVHYRDSILNNFSFPNDTELWYGGWVQWQNPLWSFLYLPATLIWLIMPLDWGTKIVYVGHLIFSILIAKKLASLFLKSEIEKISVAILLTSPVLPAFTGGHVEKLMSWGWILLAIYFVLDEKKEQPAKGLFSGLCLGIIPLTGSNYYALYSAILLIPLALANNGIKNFKYFLFGSLIGLLHLPSVLHLIGQPRSDPSEWIPFFSSSLSGIFLSLGFGISNGKLPIGPETWALIGLPALYLFIKSFSQQVIAFIKEKTEKVKIQIALCFSILIFIILATGFAYQGHHLLDTFRVPARAIAFIAVAILIFVLVSLKPAFIRQFDLNKILWGISAIQVIIFTFLILPQPAPYSPYDPQSQALAKTLKENSAEQVWLSTTLDEMYIQVVLNQNGIGLPNVYYGDMGQEVKVTGKYCGYSFDSLVTKDQSMLGYIELKSDMNGFQPIGKISLENLFFVKSITIHNQDYSIYKVVCD